MELLLTVGAIWALFAIIGALKKKNSGTSSSSTMSRRSGTSSVRTKRDSSSYRPSATVSSGTTSRHKIQFREKGGDSSLLSDQDVRDLVDALTGASLQPALGLYQCQRCKVFYQTHSFEVIQSENGGRCVSCLHTDIESVTSRREQRGRNADVNAVTLENYRQFVGHVITFEGVVYKVLPSRTGTDYAVMFEDQTWSRGFKMVVFRGDVDRIGGARFLLGLTGHRVRVRGLVIRHKRFGYEIIISDRAMILGVQ